MRHSEIDRRADIDRPDLDEIRSRLRDLTDIDVDGVSPEMLANVYETVKLFFALDAQRWDAWTSWTSSAPAQRARRRI